MQQCFEIIVSSNQTIQQYSIYYKISYYNWQFIEVTIKLFFNVNIFFFLFSDASRVGSLDVGEGGWELRQERFEERRNSREEPAARCWW